MLASSGWVPVHGWHSGFILERGFSGFLQFEKKYDMTYIGALNRVHKIVPKDEY